MEYLFLSFLFLCTLTSTQSVNNDNLNSSPNIAPSMQPATSSSKQNANSPNSHSSYPPGYENDDAPLQSQSQFPSFPVHSISGLPSSLISTNTRKDEGANSDTDTIIKNICDNTDYPDLCTATVAPFMRGTIINVQNVLQVAMKQSDAFAKLGFATFKRASESPATPPKTKKMLKTCLDSWDTVLYNYEEAIEALRIHDSGRMSTMLSAAITDISDCEDAFEGVITPMSGYSERMTKMTSNCLAIISQLPI
ncbi:pectinesterase inhibitor 3-like [Solanum dulcamara]|uniref:pectinesterase inhibitor 3-like n=1 Tax=Solanum dulcamara TaxID=45834 RepID=UPI002486063F|nr:pectinesterase inhibitor 3-like [Solanum dulcamara]